MPIVPPLRFATVHDCPGLYRSSYPRSINTRFLRRLKLKTILSLTPKPLEGDVAEWCKQQNITLLHLECEKASKKGVPTHETSLQAIRYMIEGQRAPMLVHCLNGAEITGAIISCLRKLDCWTLPDIISEYARFVEGGPTSAAISYLERFTAVIHVPVDQVNWLWRGASEQPGAVIAQHPTLEISYDDAGRTSRAEQLFRSLQAIN